MALPQNLFLKQIWPIKIGHPRENENVSPIFAGGYFHGKIYLHLLCIFNTGSRKKRCNPSVDFVLLKKPIQ